MASYYRDVIEPELLRAADLDGNGDLRRRSPAAS